MDSVTDGYSRNRIEKHPTKHSTHAWRLNGSISTRCSRGCFNLPFYCISCEYLHGLQVQNSSSSCEQPLNYIHAETCKVGERHQPICSNERYTYLSRHRLCFPGAATALSALASGSGYLTTHECTDCKACMQARTIKLKFHLLALQSTCERCHRVVSSLIAIFTTQLLRKIAQGRDPGYPISG